MEAAAIPGIAIPLLQDDCIDTDVDIDWVWDVIHLTSDDRTCRLDLDAHPPRGRPVVHARRPRRAAGSGPHGDTERIGRAWLTRAGKRWRPFLTVCVYTRVAAGS